MKALRLAAVFLSLGMAVSCVATSRTLPEKYNFNSTLEEIDQITTFSQPAWEQLDEQSILLRANWNEYYLLVLRRPIKSRIPGLLIGLSRTTSTITAGHDRISVDDSTGPRYYMIDRIYRLKGKEQAEEIREMLRE
jgi:hypothetical protein